MTDHEKILCFTCKRCKGITWAGDSNDTDRYLAANIPICDKKHSPASKCPEYVRRIEVPICFTCIHFKGDKLEIRENNLGHEWIDISETYSDVCDDYDYVGLHFKCPDYKKVVE